MELDKKILYKKVEKNMKTNMSARCKQHSPEKKIENLGEDFKNKVPVSALCGK